MKPFFLFALFAVQSLFAQASEGLAYQERPALGLIYEMSNLEAPEYEFLIMGKPFDLNIDYSPLMGFGANLPFNNYIGLNGIVGFQKMNFDYDILDTAFAREFLDTSTFTNLTASDFNGDFNSFNLMVQAGFEVGLPLFSHYSSQTMFKLLAYGNGIAGKNFLQGDMKFQNGTLWGYAYGAGGRLALGRFALNAGLRSSYVYWRLYFDPSEQTGLSRKDDTFMLSYESNFNPYFQISVAFY